MSLYAPLSIEILNVLSGFKTPVRAAVIFRIICIQFLVEEPGGGFYAALQKLLEKGYVESLDSSDTEDDPELGRKASLYRITEHGQRRLDRITIARDTSRSIAEARQLWFDNLANIDKAKAEITKRLFLVLYRHAAPVTLETLVALGKDQHDLDTTDYFESGYLEDKFRELIPELLEQEVVRRVGGFYQLSTDGIYLLNFLISTGEIPISLKEAIDLRILHESVAVEN